jgi:AcrR family transcriptional regulator
MVAGSPQADGRSDSGEVVPLETGWDRRRRRIAEHIEQTAIQLFAKRGYRHVSIEEIAVVAGISSRTVARYFPTKEDLLLARPRRGYDETLRVLEDMGPTSRPVNSAWQMWLQLAQEHQTELKDFLLWRKAADTAPEVVARALGEHYLALQTSLTELCAEGLDADPESDPGPLVLAACIAAANRAIVDFWAAKQGEYDLEELFSAGIRVLNREFSTKRLSAAVMERPVRARSRTGGSPKQAIT